MERFHSWSRCVYNYTLGNRILSVYKRRMFWQALRFFENSLRKQLWPPSAQLPLATVRTLGHQHPVPGPSGYWLGPSSQRWLIGLYSQPILETTTAPVVWSLPSQPSTGVCLWKLSSTAELLQKFNESSCQHRTGWERASHLTPKTSVPNDRGGGSGGNINHVWSLGFLIAEEPLPFDDDKDSWVPRGIRAANDLGGRKRPPVCTSGLWARW